MIFKTLKNDNRFIIQNFNNGHSCFAFTFVIKPKYKKYKNKLFKMLKKNNIEFRLITGGSFKHPVKKYFSFQIQWVKKRRLYSSKWFFC